MNELFSQIFALRDERQAESLSYFFKTGPGQYGEGDVFLGLKSTSNTPSGETPLAAMLL